MQVVRGHSGWPHSRYAALTKTYPNSLQKLLWPGTLALSIASHRTASREGPGRGVHAVDQ